MNFKIKNYKKYNRSARASVLSLNTKTVSAQVSPKLVKNKNYETDTRSTRVLGCLSQVT